MSRDLPTGRGAEVDPDLLATIRDLISAHALTPHDPQRGVDLDIGLWDQLDRLGLARLTGREEDGGSGASWYESAALLTELAAHAVALPVGEHDLLAAWLLRAAGLTVDERRRTIATLSSAGVGLATPWARHAESVVCVWPSDSGWRVADASARELAIAEGLNLAGEPRDDVRLDVARRAGVTVATDVVDELRLRSALVRAVQVAGALERCLSLTLTHTTTRAQFGRPLSRFQAVQHLLAQIAAETSLARAAVDAAVQAVARRDSGLTAAADLAFPIAVARSCVGHAASVVVRNAHQLHGAIGTTLEHDLHRATLPALAWRSEYGSTQYWDTRVAALATAAGDGLWELITV